MSLTQMKAAFDCDGYVIVREFLRGADFAELTTHLDRYIRDVVPGLPGKSAFYDDRDRPETLKQLQHMGIDPHFAAYARHPKWVELAQGLLGEEAHADQPEWFNKPPGTNHPTPPHQDNYYFCLNPCSVVTIWLALEKVDAGNGCLRYIPGSHRLPVRPHGHSKTLGFSQGITDYSDSDREAEVEIHLEPGDAVAHHGNLIHRAEPNRSPNRGRRAFAMVFWGVSCRRDEEAYARYTAALKKQHEALGLKT